MNCKSLVSVCVVAVVFWGGCVGAAEADAKKQLEQNIGALHRMLTLLTSEYGVCSNESRDLVLARLAWAEYAYGFAQFWGLGVLSTNQEDQLLGALAGSEPHLLANELVRDKPERAITLIRGLPGFVTIDAVELAERIGLGNDAVALATLVGQHNVRQRGYAPADLLPLIPNGNEYAEAIWAGRVSALLPD